MELGTCTLHILHACSFFVRHLRLFSILTQVSMGAEHGWPLKWSARWALQTLRVSGDSSAVVYEMVLTLSMDTPMIIFHELSDDRIMKGIFSWRIDIHVDRSYRTQDRVALMKSSISERHIWSKTAKTRFHGFCVANQDRKKSNDVSRFSCAAQCLNAWKSTST